jgi:predicted nucleic acid-binding protein
MILFDTDTVTHFSYGNANLRRKIEEAGNEPLAITIITRYEILRGRAENLLKAANEEELRKAAQRFRQSEELLADFVVVDFDDNAIGQFGRLRKQKNLKKMGRADMLIACLALANDALLVTKNLRDYKDVAGLRRENWVG